MKLFELLNCGEVAVQWARIRGAADTRQVGTLIVSPRVGEGTRRRRVRCYIGEGIEKMRELIGNPVLLQVGDVVSGVVDIPLDEVPPENLVVLSKGGNTRGHEHQQACT